MKGAIASIRSATKPNWQEDSLGEMIHWISRPVLEWPNPSLLPEAPLRHTSIDTSGQKWHVRTTFLRCTSSEHLSPGTINLTFCRVALSTSGGNNFFAQAFRSAIFDALALNLIDLFYLKMQSDALQRKRDNWSQAVVRMAIQISPLDSVARIDTAREIKWTCNERQSRQLQADRHHHRWRNLDSNSL